MAIALLKDNLHCADLLLSKDIDADFPDDKGATILMRQLLFLLDENNLEKVKFLVEKKGAGVDKTDLKECTPVCSFLFSKGIEIIYIDSAKFLLA